MNIKLKEEFMNVKWFRISIPETFSILQTGWEGLTEEEAKRRLAEFGPNEIATEKKSSPLVLFFKQFLNLLSVILMAAALISLFIGDVLEAVTILAIVFLAGVLGFLQEYKAERALEALKKLATPKATVIRGGKEIELPARELVPGDLVILKAGNRVPADGRVVEAVNLLVEEAVLTGESIPVEKNTQPIAAEEVPLPDRVNMVFSGTLVVNGRGKMVVTATGMKSAFGQIAGLLQEVEEKKTLLQVELDRTGKRLGTFALILCAVISLFGILRGYPVIDMFIWGVALAVAIIPEALPAVVTIGLALGLRRMVKRNALVRKLQAVETLGCVTYICSDKTGTLTKNEMTVKKIWLKEKILEVEGVGYEPTGSFLCEGKPFPSDDPQFKLMLTVATLCNDARLYFSEEERAWKILGDPTEGALIVASAKANLWKDELNSAYPRIDEIPFDSKRKMMTTLYKVDGRLLICSKGAPKALLNVCSYLFAQDGVVPLTQDLREDLIKRWQDLASEGLRLIGVVYKEQSEADYRKEDLERDLTLIGVFGLIDPPREEAKIAVSTCYQAGIKPVMITGDHKVTAVAIARELGIYRVGEVVTGDKLDQMSDEELEAKVERIEVYARVSPESKLRIVRALQKRGHIVAMTGDGVNDAPALKQADVGVAMGQTGTDVAKEAASVILLDDNFATIVSAVEEGRTIYANIRKYLMYLLTGNVGTVLGLMVAMFFGMPLPLTAVQILFINLLMDGAPAVALSVEPSDPEIMKKPPRDPKERILNPFTIKYIFLMGSYIGLLSLLFFYLYLHHFDTTKAMTMFFAAIICFRLANALNCRLSNVSLFKLGLFSNKWLIIGLSISLLLMLTVIYVPALAKAFHLVPLGLKDWLILLFSALSVILIDEVRKFFFRK